MGAEVAVRQIETGLTRKATTTTEGAFRIEALEPGTYEIGVSSPGFETTRRELTLLVGDSRTVNLELKVEGATQRIDVKTEVSGVNAVEYKVDGRVSRVQIENLPLNGRSFLELAQLEPGIQVVSVTNPGGLGNNYQQILVGGAIFTQTRISIDGSTVGDRLIGGTTQGLSQESVQEFQVSTFNLDLATGLTGSGAINIVSRRGSNDLHGSAFFYYRDHNLAAYPGLRRSASNPDPPFARRQSGFNLGGPLRRDRLFWFANYEHNNQDAVFAITNNHPIFSKLDVIHPNPLDSDLLNLRIDGKRATAIRRSCASALTRTTPWLQPGLSGCLPTGCRPTIGLSSSRVVSFPWSRRDWLTTCASPTVILGATSTLSQPANVRIRLPAWV